MHILPTLLEQGLAPDVIDDTNPDDIYLGYFKYNSDNDPNHCLIKRIKKVDGITHIKYPFGRFDFNRDWAERASLIDWRYRDFPLVFNDIKLGMLYNGHAAFNVKNIANVGFRLLTKPEIIEMWNDFDPVNNVLLFGGFLKEVSAYWQNPNTGATNLSGFNARGSGWRDTDGQFYGLNTTFQFWHEVDGVSSNMEQLTFSSAAIFGGLYDHKRGLSVRLIKESTDLAHGETGYYIGNDGKVYPTICIYGKEITAVSIAETLYRDGTEIPNVSDNTEWAALTTGARCSYSNIDDNV